MIRKTLCLSVFYILLVAGNSFAAGLSLDHVDGLWGSDSLTADTQITFHIRVTNDAGQDYPGLTNGFRIYSPSGHTWSDCHGDTTGLLGATRFDLVCLIKPCGITGGGADTVGFGAAARDGSGIPAGFDDTSFTITIGPIPRQAHGGQICLDSSFFPASGWWLWGETGGGNMIPSWDGPHCFTVVDPFLAVDVEDGDDGLVPTTFSLSQNYPNPFNPRTEIGFSLPEASAVELAVYNILGRRVKTLFAGNLSAGDHTVAWDGTDAEGLPSASGVYFYRVAAQSFTETRKMVLMK